MFACLFKFPHVFSNARMSAWCRLCCKSRKLKGRKFFAKRRNGNQSPIRITSIALPKSPVSLSRGDEVPHIFTRKPRPRPAEFSVTSAKRLLQQNRPEAVITPAGRSRLFQRNLDLAIHALFHERESDPATEFVRNEIAYEIGAVAGVSCSRHRRAAQFAPYQDQVRGCASVQLALPTHRHSTTRGR